MILQPSYSALARQYNELRAAILDYVSDDATQAEKRVAYGVMTRAIRTGAIDMEAAQADYDATIADFEAMTGRV